MPLETGLCHVSQIYDVKGEYVCSWRLYFPWKTDMRYRRQMCDVEGKFVPCYRKRSCVVEGDYVSLEALMPRKVDMCVKGESVFLER